MRHSFFIRHSSFVIYSSLLPEKVLQAEAAQSRFRFVAARPASRSELLVNHGGRLPFRIVLEQTGGVESRLVIPEEFPLRPVGPIFFLDNLIESGERIFAISEFLEADPLLEQSLVAPMDGRILLRGELVVNLDRALVVLPLGLAKLIKNIALAAKRLAFFLRLRVPLQDFVVKRGRVLILAQLALDRGPERAGREDRKST